MARKSTIERLPNGVRELIGSLRGQGRTIDEILAKLGELDASVSRSALGRHVRKIDAMAAELRRSRAAAEAIVERLGDAPESRVARLNIELMHSIVMKLLFAEDGAMATLDAREAMFVADALRKLSQAEKADTDRVLRVRKEVAGEAAKAATGAARKAGLSAEAIAEIERDVLGIA